MKYKNGRIKVDLNNLYLLTRPIAITNYSNEFVTVTEQLQ